MGPIDVEPLSSAPLALVPYGTSKEDIPMIYTTRKQPLNSIEESLSVKGLDLE